MKIKKLLAQKYRAPGLTVTRFNPDGSKHMFVTESGVIEVDGIKRPYSVVLCIDKLDNE